MKKVKFLITAGRKYGMGHLIRCISLASMIKKLFICEFFLSKDSVGYEKSLKDFTFHLIKDTNEFIINLRPKEIVIVDSYSFNQNIFKEIKKMNVVLGVIDDLLEKNENVDFIINHANYTDKSSLLKGKTYILGAKYALLRPQFLKKINVKYESPPKKVFICFGGTDSKNFTLNTIKNIDSIKSNLSLDIVVGSSYVFTEKLTNYIEKNKNKNIRISHDLSANEMVSKMKKNDLLIIPASGILFEAISVRKPIVSGFVTNNQNMIYKGFKKSEIFYDAIDFSFENFVRAWNNINNLTSRLFIQNQKKVIDKNSPVRFRKIFSKL